MDTTLTNLYDVALYRGLTRMHRSMNGLLATRSLDELTPAEVHLERNWQRDLEPALTDLYWYPLKNGVDSAPESESALRRWLRDALASGAAVAALLLLLKRYQRLAVNVGGNMALDFLSLSGNFQLANNAYLAQLDTHAEMLTTVGSDMSLIDTTVEHLVSGIPTARNSSDNTLTVIGTMIAGWAAYRSVNIAVTEEARQVGNGLVWTYSENGVQTQTFATRGDDRVCTICAPHDGEEMPIDNIPAGLLVPLHVNCRCGYRAVLTGWIRPVQIWRGE